MHSFEDHPGFRGALRRIALGTALAGGSLATAAAAELPQGAAAAPEAEAVMRTCPNLGSGFFKVPGQEVCLRIGVDLLYEVKGDAANRDIVIDTVPILGTPAAVYEAADISDTATRYRSRTSGTVSLTAVSALGNEALVSHLGLRSGIDDSNAADRRSGEETVPSTYLDQAWISWNGVMAGLRPSMFDFSSGYTYSGGYASQRRTHAVSYEASFDKGASLALSVEDPAFRRYQDFAKSNSSDGRWADYGPQHYPDVVLRGEMSPEWGTVHVAGAVHSINDAINGKDSIGWAANGGLELRPKWGDILGMEAGNTRGRLMVTAAYADGALDYLGIPRFSTDYIATPDGKITRTRGASAVVSYEHVWRPDLKTVAALSAYKTLSDVDSFQWETRGGLAQVGVEYMPAANTFLGAEVNYFYDDVKGQYFGVDGDRTSADFFQVYAYLRRRV